MRITAVTQDGGEASGTPTRSKPVHGPYQGKLSMAAKPSPTVAEKPVATADEESELARVCVLPDGGDPVLAG